MKVLDYVKAGRVYPDHSEASHVSIHHVCEILLFALWQRPQRMPEKLSRRREAKTVFIEGSHCISPKILDP